MKIGFRGALIAVCFFLFIQFLSLCSGMTYIASLPQIDHPEDIHLEDIHPDHIVPLDPFLSASSLPLPDVAGEPSQKLKLPEFLVSPFENQQFLCLTVESRQRWKKPPFLRCSGELWLVNQTILI